MNIKLDENLPGIFVDANPDDNTWKADQAGGHSGALHPRSSSAA